MAGAPLALPALTRAVKLQEKAGKVGFDWNDAHAVLAKLREETAEIEEALAAGDAEGVKGEVGDLLFVVANLARHLSVDPETALRGANAKFERRFAHIEARLGDQGRRARRGEPRGNGRAVGRSQSVRARAGVSAAAPAKGADVHVALLRGVNVGGANKLAMSDLKAIFEGAGCSRVETIIQSGNVVFAAPSALVGDLAAIVAAEIKRRFGVETPVILRSGAEMRAILEGNPFLAAGVDPAVLHVMCLANRPSKDEIAALDPDRSPPDEFVVRDKDIYLHLPNGVARSKLTNAYFDKALRTIGTARNWRTMTKLCEAAES